MPADPYPTDTEVTKVQRLLLAPNGVSLELPLMAGELVQGRYELDRYIGSGGIGIVVAARHCGFDEPVALKFLRPAFCADALAVGRFALEARASFKLRSPHVARLIDVDAHGGVPFLVMELLEGASLRELQRQGLELTPELAVDYMLQVCEALAAAHALGIVHRDIKPENLFVSGDAQSAHVRVLDFGISKVALQSTGRTSDHAANTDVAAGTPPYMAPEQIRGAGDLDARADLFSLGCVLYELLAGQPAFERESSFASCAAVLEDEPPALSLVRDDVAIGLCDVIARCLAKQPEARWQDSAELARALEPFGTGRYAAYPARCQAYLNGEPFGLWSTPSAVHGLDASAAVSGEMGMRVSHVRRRSAWPSDEPLDALPGPLRVEPAHDSRAITLSEVVPRHRLMLQLAWLVPVGTALALAIYWFAVPRSQPKLIELRPREVAAVSAHPDVELGAALEPGPSEEALPLGQTYPDRPRTRRRRALVAEAADTPEAKRATNAPSRTWRDNEPDVGF